MTNEIKLFEQQFKDLESFIGLTTKKDLIGLVVGEYTDSEDGNVMAYATEKLRENAQKLEATHVCGIKIELKSNHDWFKAIIYGTAYKIGVKN